MKKQQKDILDQALVSFKYDIFKSLLTQRRCDMLLFNRSHFHLLKLLLIFRIVFIIITYYYVLIILLLVL